ncbi:ABC transporter ATP-binding protein [Ramlibacter sp.]|uniref:ABC transporter ATP-binding protein n=1 Tax=Ramlibacter sp. TaxID=1917967 RepID=UPI0035AFA443
MNMVDSAPPSPAPAAAPGSSVLAVRGLGKEYRLYDTPRQRLKALFTSGTHHRSHWALSEVSFELHRGQCMGLIGDNGAGKSSLLKLIAGTMQPTTGEVRRIGRVTAILELGAGFHPDFSGRDNLRFSGHLTGLDPEEIARLEPEIIEFSELGSAIDRPVKTYSSGMVVRLAFALVTAKQPDVLIIDEALAVGDQHFQKKCVERITAFRQNGCTILFCSHSQYHVRQLCDVALWLDGGRMRALGATDTVLAAYEAHVRAQDLASAPAPSPSPEQAVAAAPPPILAGQRGRITRLAIDHLGPGTPPLLASRDLVVTVEALVEGGEMPHIAVMLEQSHGVGITSVATHADGAHPQAVGPDLWRSVCTFPDLPLHSGEYVVSAYLFDSKALVVYDQWYQHQHFRFHFPTLTPGLVRLPHHWS